MRDLDAHSWVEVWYSGYRLGDLRPDPGRRAGALAADDDRRPAAGGARAGAPDLGGDMRSRPQPRRAATTGRAAVDADRPRRRRRARARRPSRCGSRAGTGARLAAGWGPVAELERALRARAGRDPGRAATLSTIEALFARTPAAAGYVRAAARAALRRPRRRRRAAPSGARLRAELARGGGLAGRLRAWWALPPRTAL